MGDLYRNVHFHENIPSAQIENADIEAIHYIIFSTCTNLRIKVVWGVYRSKLLMQNKMNNISAYCVAAGAAGVADGGSSTLIRFDAGSSVSFDRSMAVACEDDAAVC